MKEGVFHFKLCLYLCGIATFLLISCTDKQEKTYKEEAEWRFQAASAEGQLILTQIENVLKERIPETEQNYAIFGPVNLVQDTIITSAYEDELNPTYQVLNPDEKLYVSYDPQSLFAQDTFYFIFNEANGLKEVLPALWWPQIRSLDNEVLMNLGPVSGSKVPIFRPSLVTREILPALDAALNLSLPSSPPANTCCHYKRIALAVMLNEEVGGMATRSISIFDALMRRMGYTVYGHDTPYVDYGKPPPHLLRGPELMPEMRSKRIRDEFKQLLAGVAQQFDEPQSDCPPPCCGEVVIFAEGHGSNYQGGRIEGYRYADMSQDIVEAFKNKCLRITVIISSCYSGSALDDFQKASSQQGRYCPFCTVTSTTANRSAYGTRLMEQINACEMDYKMKNKRASSNMGELMDCIVNEKRVLVERRTSQKLVGKEVKKVVEESYPLERQGIFFDDPERVIPQAQCSEKLN